MKKEKEEEYNKNLEERKLSYEMIIDSIYSCNKYAKKYRDVSWCFKILDRQNEKEETKDKEALYYEYKKKILKATMEVKCIHRVGDKYFLYYEHGDMGFHTPITNKEQKEYKNIKVIRLEELRTITDSRKNLLSEELLEKICNAIIKKTCKIEE